MARPLESPLRVLRAMREVLVDRAEGCVDAILETLVTGATFTRDDREEVMGLAGPRARVRRLLDILECKGDEAAGTFFQVLGRSDDITAERRKTNVTHTTDYSKAIEKHKAVLRRRSESMLCCNSRHGEKISFSQRYVNLVVVRGHHSLEMRRHEVLSFGQRRLALQAKSLEKRQITPAQLFTNSTGSSTKPTGSSAKSQPPKRVLVTGVAGIGKTVLVQKILSDFASNIEHQEFDFVIHLTFRDLNLISKPVSFWDLVLHRNGHLAKCVEAVLANESKLLVVLDGFDEFRHYRSCNEEDMAFVTEPDEKGEVAEVFSSLIQGELLPEASVLLTSRPMAISHVPVVAIDRFTVITGFSTVEIQDFFGRYFQEEGQAKQMFEKMVANELMLTLCYIPAFCHIVCSILRDCSISGGDRSISGSDSGVSGDRSIIGSDREGGIGSWIGRGGGGDRNSGSINGGSGAVRVSSQYPKTMTDIYCQYLVALLRTHSSGRVDVCDDGNGNGGRGEMNEQERLKETVMRLGKLAYHKLLDHQTLFYSRDLEAAEVLDCALISSFLDKASVQEAGFTEDVFSFTHLTVQEFFAALHCSMAGDEVSPEKYITTHRHGDAGDGGHLDLFERFLSGLLSTRNRTLLSRCVGFEASETREDAYRQVLLQRLHHLCETGSQVLTSLHCLFEQQDDSLLVGFDPSPLRINLSDTSLSGMDLAAITDFLRNTTGIIAELDLTGANVTVEMLRTLQPHLLRCTSLWLGENALDMEAIQVVAEVLQSSDTLKYLGLGWADIGDEEVFVLANAIGSRQSLKEIWMEGNRISFRGLSSLTALTPFPLQVVVAIWNSVSEEETSVLNSIMGNGGVSDKSGSACFTAAFTEDERVWEEWGAWVLRRCQENSNEKLLGVLQKVCRGSSMATASWMLRFYQQLLDLIEERMERCCEEDEEERNTCRRLQEFASALLTHSIMRD